MKDTIPMHRHKDLAWNGINLKIITPEDVVNHPVEYVHRDDYFVFGLMVRGQMTFDVDFERQNVSAGAIGFIRPGQIHRFLGGDDFEGWMLMVESEMVCEQYKMIFEEVSFSGKTLWIADLEIGELKTLYKLIYDLVAREEEMSIIRDLVSAFIGMIAVCFKRMKSECTSYHNRHAEIVFQFNLLLQKHITESHTPSFYADKLNLSPVYLNEVVKRVTGYSASNYIKNEIVLRAQRLLYHTNLTVKEIALALGFEDNAYFTRLFTRATGKSPLQFRTKP